MRLTKKGIDNNYVVDTYISLNEPWKTPINKLGQLEDIEDELGIDLIGFLKGIELDTCRMGITNDKELYLDQEGFYSKKDLLILIQELLYEYWALTKEELQ